MGWFKDLFRDSEREAELERQVVRLQEENAILTREVTVARNVAAEERRVAEQQRRLNVALSHPITSAKEYVARVLGVLR